MENPQKNAEATAISFVDGEQGRLFYRGINVEFLAAEATFEETVWLLLHGKMPNQNVLSAFRWSFQHANHTHEKVIRIIKEFPAHANPLFILQAGLASLACFEKAYQDEKESNNLEKIIQIITQTAIILGAAYRHLQSLPIIEPRNDLSFVENFIYMITGKIPSKLKARCLEVALIVQMDHGVDAAAFTARVLSSTLSNAYAVISAAAGALSGPFHGGASKLVMDMLQDAKTSGHVRSFVINILNAGGRIMGMGHKTYKKADPRARIMHDLLLQITPKEENSDLFILEEIAKVSHEYFEEKHKSIYVNLDFWVGSLYKKIGILPILYPSIFAMARTVGWCAHILEVRQNTIKHHPENVFTGNTSSLYSHKLALKI